MNIRRLFEIYFGGKIPEDAKTHKVNCCWHDDKDPSVELKLDTGDFHCYGCGKQGNITKLVNTGRAISEEEVNKHHERLAENGSMLKWFMDDKGLSSDTIKRYKIGHNGGRYTIPVRDADGTCINIRLYLPGGTPKFIPYGEGFGEIAFFPFPPTENTIFLMEGETDTLLARQLGFPAYCQTAGAKSWSPELTTVLAGKKVNIIYDVDKAGSEGAAKVVNALKFVCPEVKNIKMSLSPGMTDFSDWMIRDGGTLRDLEELIRDTPAYAVGTPTANANDIVDIPLWDTSESRYAMRNIRTEVLVAGKESSPFIIPRFFHIECTPGSPRTCGICPNNPSGSRRYELNPEDHNVLQLVDVTEEKKNPRIYRIIGLIETCKRCKMFVEEFQSIERVVLYPRTEWFILQQGESYQNVLRKAYFLGSGLQANHSYKIVGKPVPDPRDQTCSIIIYDAEILNKNTLCDEDRKKCEVFRVSPIKNEIGEL